MPVMRPRGRSPALLLLTPTAILGAALCLGAPVGPPWLPTMAIPLATTGASPPALNAQPERSADDRRGDELRREVCTRCHVLPPPDVLPGNRWRDAIARMYLRRENKAEPPAPGQAALIELPDEFATIARYYRRHAPAALPPPEPWPAAGAHRLKFRIHALAPADGAPGPAVSNVRFVDFDGDRRLELIVCDMRYGLVLLGRPYDTSRPLVTLGHVPHPAKAEVVDLDGDGLKDLLVADLGDFLPSDHLKGSVTWLRGQPDGKFAAFAIDGLPRVSDVQAADIDGDGDMDLVVAAFGWRTVGHVALLRNDTTDWARPSFTAQVIDARAGAIHVPVLDLDGDGHLDVLALLSQQHERVVAYYSNAPQPGFTMETLYTAPHPNWGSAGIQVVDLDGDGDLDILLAHGDTLDDAIVKPYHGIQWLENRGGFEMVAHTLATLPGVLRAVAADLDGDGDLDVLASAMIPLDEGLEGTPAIVWLEQTTKGAFKRHTLKAGLPRHATIEAGDYDLDGDIDFAVGVFTTGGQRSPWVEVWENLAIDNASPSAAPTGAGRSRR
jgi:hypothetical protein